MKKKLSAVLALAILSAGAVMAQTAPDYGATLNTNLDTIDGIWGTVATIMIGSALVAVGVRFFRKAK